MSMKVERDITGRKFIVSLEGIRKREPIKDLDELKIAVAHYFGVEPYHRDHKSECPLCRSERR